MSEMPKRRGRGPGARNGTLRKWLHDHVSHTGEECLIWPFGTCHPGYGTITYDGKATNAHRVMCRLAHGEPPTPRHHAAHSCGNRRCVNPQHLSWKTPSENQLDRELHGQKAAGRVHPKVTADQLLEILRSIENPPTVAARYGITESRVRQIRHKRG